LASTENHFFRTLLVKELFDLAIWLVTHTNIGGYVAVVMYPHRRN